MPKKQGSVGKKPGVNDFFKLNDRLKLVRLSDAGAATAFAGAIAALVLIAFYVASRLAADRTYREKWRDYNDCGWA